MLTPRRGGAGRVLPHARGKAASPRAAARAAAARPAPAWNWKKCAYGTNTGTGAWARTPEVADELHNSPRQVCNLSTDTANDHLGELAAVACSSHAQPVARSAGGALVHPSEGPWDEASGPMHTGGAPPVHPNPALESTEQGEDRLQS